MLLSHDWILLGKICLGFCIGCWCNVNYGYGGNMVDVIPITPDNFEEHKRKIIRIIKDIQIDDLDINFEMSLKNGVLMGNHANQCDACNILHYLMAFVINKHRLKVDK